MQINLSKMENEELVAHIKTLVATQKKLDIEILEALREIIRRRLHLLEGYRSLADYCEKVFGLSADSAWKRSQVARTIIYHPEVLDVLKAGKTHISHLVLLAPRITEANSEKILNFLPGASKRDLQLFLSRITDTGDFRDIEETVEVKLQCNKEILEKLDRARALVGESCPGANNVDVLDKALDALLSKIDPVEKAKRAEQRAEKKVNTTPADHQLNCAGAGGKYIPAATKHLLFKKPQCDYVSPTGRRCTATTHLQIDHIQMRCPIGDSGPSATAVDP